MRKAADETVWLKTPRSPVDIEPTDLENQSPWVWHAEGPPVCDHWATSQAPTARADRFAEGFSAGAADATERYRVQTEEAAASHVEALGKARRDWEMSEGCNLASIIINELRAQSERLTAELDELLEATLKQSIADSATKYAILQAHRLVQEFTKQEIIIRGNHPVAAEIHGQLQSKGHLCAHVEDNGQALSIAIGKTSIVLDFEAILVGSDNNG
jgi:hypothetical protein